MDFSFTEAQEQFREEVRTFLEAEISQGLWKPAVDCWMTAYDPSFTRRLAGKGWIGLTWPKEFGGQGRSFVDRLILTEEILRYGAPAAAHWMADRQIGGSILKHGTEQQKRELLPKILAGEMYVGVGMSEPEAGSDLASLKTRAVKKDGSYVIDGQKTWTSGFQHVNYLYLLARTDPNISRHRGLSEFIFPKDQPGITARPIIDITGHEAWSEVFYDGVVIPQSCLIGRENGGWAQVMEQLAYERSGMERLMANYSVFQGLIQLVKETIKNGKRLADDPVVRHRLAQLKIEFDTGRLFMYRVALVMDEKRSPEWEAAMSKVYATSFEQRLAGVAMEIMGPYGLLMPGSHMSKLGGMAGHAYLSSKGYSLQGGTSEVLKNIIAQRKLGLPVA